MIGMKYNKKELAMGRKVEREHLDAYLAMKSAIVKSAVDFYDMIARAHLREVPDYYTRLKKVEGGK